MSYGHNAEADFAASELAHLFVNDPSLCYSNSQTPPNISAAAAYEPSSSPWPYADGLVSLLEPGGQRRRAVAIEYKRHQEGIHGLLTALGQANAYLHKGYNGAVLVVPRQYPTLPDSGAYLRGVLDGNTQSGYNPSIGVFGYDPPDTSSPTPFRNRLHCARPFSVNTTNSPVAAVAATQQTQWVHMREGTTTRDGFFRFLQTAKRLSSDPAGARASVRQELVDAVNRISPGSDPLRYLSSTVDDRFLSRVWREFWFEWLLTSDVTTPWVHDGTSYVTPNAFTRIEKDDGTGPSQLFEGRRNGLKEVLVDLLNRGAITEAEAWERFVTGFAMPGQQRKQGIRDRAHSYRQDVDSALAYLNWIEPDGHPTDLGYHYLAICERYGGANSEAAKEYFGATLLQTGHYGSFLYYIYRLSEERFAQDPLAFTHPNAAGRPVFDDTSYSNYLQWLETEFVDNLRVMRTATGRSTARQRTPFQVELTLLRKYGFVSSARYRLGVGIPIDWIKVQDAMNLAL
jgi:hypothetical protein